MRERIRDWSFSASAVSFEKNSLIVAIVAAFV